MLKKNKLDTVTVDEVQTDISDVNHWKYKSKKLKVNIGKNDSVIIESKDKGVNYLTFYENNTNFSLISKKHKKLIFNDTNTIEIEGKTSGGVKLIIYIIEYDKNHKRVHTNRFRLNDHKQIIAQRDTRYARIAVRVVGKGEIHITKFQMQQGSINLKLNDNIDSLNKMKDINMACIFDEFTMASFKDVVNLITFTPENWYKKFQLQKPDLLFVESAWKGNSGTWEFQVGKYNNNNENLKLKKVINWCKKNNIPTIFWNKEDPVHFEKFKDPACLFDYVLTTDADMIPAYRNYVGHNRVSSMQFAANPLIHNPISLRTNKKDKISFAGSYYSNRHEDRKKDMDDILDVAQMFGLDIYDRNYVQNQAGPTPFQFPDKYQKNIIGNLKVTEMYKAYKDYRLILNVNSVKSSPTMFSRRVFEGLATGTPVISSYATGIKKTFHSIVSLDEDRKDFEDEVRQLMTDDAFYRERSLTGMREVFNKHTYENRMEFILDFIGLSYSKNERMTTVLFEITHEEQIYKALEIINSQTYENIKVIFLLKEMFDGFEYYYNQYNNEKISTFIYDHVSQYNTIDELIHSEFITIMSTDFSYGSYYIEDLIHAAVYSDADIIGKRSLNENNDYAFERYEYQYVSEINCNTALFKREVIKNYSFETLIQEKEDLIAFLFAQEGRRVFSSDKFNFKEIQSTSLKR